MGIKMGTNEPADSYYLAILTEVGPLGSFLYFGFFANIVKIALGSMRQTAADMRRLQVGMVAGLTALATQSIADGPLAGHAVGGALWLFAALIVAIRRSNPTEPRPGIAGGRAALAQSLDFAEAKDGIDPALSRLGGRDFLGPPKGIERV